MSQYTHFFVVNAGSDEFVEIGCYGRSSKIAEIFSWYAPWERIKRISEKIISEVRNNCNDEILALKKRFDDYEERKNLIAGMNNSIDDKIEWLNEVEISQKDIIEEIEAAEFSKNFISFLSEIVENGVEVYCGIECGDKVDREDIV